MLLAFGPTAVQSAFVSAPLVARTGKTVTDAAQLMRMFEEIRTAGFAIDDEESEVGQRCIAAPVRDISSKVIAAVGLARADAALEQARPARHGARGHRHRRCRLGAAGLPRTMSEVAAYRIRIAGTDLDFPAVTTTACCAPAQRAGLGFPYECNVGSCGNCRFELVEGEVTSVWPAAPALSEKDRLRNRHLGCQTHALSDCTIKLRPAERYVPPHRPLRMPAC